jgi:hypothetical protein
VSLFFFFYHQYIGSRTGLGTGHGSGGVHGFTRDAEVSDRLGFVRVSGFHFFGSHNTFFYSVFASLRRFSPIYFRFNVDR